MEIASLTREDLRQYCFGLEETFTIPSDRSGMVDICFDSFLVNGASEGGAIGARNWNG